MDNHTIAPSPGRVSAPQANAAPSRAIQLPLHSLIERGAPPEAVVELLSANPGAATFADGHGMLPLHWAACQGASWPVVSALLAAAPGATLGCDRYGKLPLHYAVFYNALSDEAILALLSEAPRAALARDVGGSLPLDYALESCSSPVVVAALRAALDAAAAAGEAPVAGRPARPAGGVFMPFGSQAPPLHGEGALPFSHCPHSVFTVLSHCACTLLRPRAVCCAYANKPLSLFVRCSWDVVQVTHAIAALAHAAPLQATMHLSELERLRCSCGRRGRRGGSLYEALKKVVC